MRSAPDHHAFHEDAKPGDFGASIGGEALEFFEPVHHNRHLTLRAPLTQKDHEEPLVVERNIVLWIELIGRVTNCRKEDLMLRHTEGRCGDDLSNNKVTVPIAIEQLSARMGPHR